MQHPLTHYQREKLTIVVIKLVGKQKSEKGKTANMTHFSTTAVS